MKSTRRGFLALGCGAATTVGGCAALGQSPDPLKEIEVINLSGTLRTVDLTVTDDAENVLFEDVVSVDADTLVRPGTFRGEASELVIVIDETTRIETEWLSSGSRAFVNGTRYPAGEMPNVCDSQDVTGAEIWLSGSADVQIMASCDDNVKTIRTEQTSE